MFISQKQIKGLVCEIFYVLCARWNLGIINIYFPSSWLKISSKHFSTLHVVMLWLIKSWTKCGGDSTFVQLVFHMPAFVQSMLLGGYLSLYNTILILSANNIFYVPLEASSFSLQGCSIYLYIYIYIYNTKKTKKSKYHFGCSKRELWNA